MTLMQDDTITVDWNRVQELYVFSRTRAIDRILAAEHEHEYGQAGTERHQLRIIETMYAQARQHDDVVADCAVLYLRSRAMRDAQHVDFLGEWIIAAP